MQWDVINAIIGHAGRKQRTTLGGGEAWSIIIKNVLIDLGSLWVPIVTRKKYMALIVRSHEIGLALHYYYTLIG